MQGAHSMRMRLKMNKNCARIAFEVTRKRNKNTVVQLTLVINLIMHYEFFASACTQRACTHTRIRRRCVVSELLSAAAASASRVRSECHSATWLFAIVVGIIALRIEVTGGTYLSPCSAISLR